MTTPDSAVLSAEAEWVRSNTGLEITAEAARCIDTLTAIQRPYNWSLIGPWTEAIRAPEPYPDDDGELVAPPRRPVVIGDTWIVVRLRNGLSTYDFSDLTALVLAAHRNAVRVDISPESFLSVDTESYLAEPKMVDGKLKWIDTDEHPSCAAACLRLQLNARRREGTHAWERHPTIEDVLARAGLTDD